MIDHPANGRPSRRDFIRLMTASGAALCLGSLRGRAATGARPQSPGPATPDFAYQYRSISIGRLGEVKEWFEKLDKDRKLSSQPIFRKYIDNFDYTPPKDLPRAKSLIIVSLPDWISAVTFHDRGISRDILIPCGYVDFWITEKMVKERVAADILKDPAAGLVPAYGVPMKTLAAYSGLATYGKNNISYVEGYGSCNSLYAFYTDKGLPDQWGPMRMLRFCKGCQICSAVCPTKAVRYDEFVIDAGKCLSLYNERKEPMPSWIDPAAHHTLAGCLRCQEKCPANREGLRNIKKLADISEQETGLLLGGGSDPALRASIAKKLERFPSAGNFDYLSRNFRLAWANAVR